MHNLLEILPYELIKIICDVIDPKILVDICIRNGKKISDLYHLNYDRITTYWWTQKSIDLIKNNDFYGVRYHMTLELDLTMNDNWYLKIACQLGSMVMLKYLAKNVNLTIDENCGIILASENGHLNAVKFLVEKGADIKAQNNLAVILACANGKIDIVKYLTLLGADITAQDNIAMRLAKFNGHTDIIKYLISQGVSEDTNDDELIVGYSYYIRGELDAGFNFFDRLS